MARRLTERQLLALKVDSLTDTEVREVLDYVLVMESMRKPVAVSSVWEDEVIALLADAPENRRARQAFEWESVRRRAERKATASGLYV